MNKKTSFWASFFVIIVAQIVTAIIEGLCKIKLDGDKTLYSLISWCIVWKLLHDKKKDE